MASEDRLVNEGYKPQNIPANMKPINKSLAGNPEVQTQEKGLPFVPPTERLFFFAQTLPGQRPNHLHSPAQRAGN